MSEIDILDALVSIEDVLDGIDRRKYAVKGYGASTTASMTPMAMTGATGVAGPTGAGYSRHGAPSNPSPAGPTMSPSLTQRVSDAQAKVQAEKERDEVKKMADQLRRELDEAEERERIALLPPPPFKLPPVLDDEEIHKSNREIKREAKKLARRKTLGLKKAQEEKAGFLRR